MDAFDDSVAEIAVDEDDVLEDAFDGSGGATGDGCERLATFS